MRATHHSWQCHCGSIRQFDVPLASVKCSCGRQMQPYHPLAVAPSEPLAELRDYDRMMRESSSPLDLP